MAFSKWLPFSSAKAPSQVFCSRLNVSVCTTTVESASFTVTLYNPIARAVDYYVSVPTGWLDHDVYDSKMKKINCSVSIHTENDDVIDIGICKGSLVLNM